MPVQEIPELQVVEQIQEQIMETFSQESVQPRTDEQIVAVARAPCRDRFTFTASVC